MYVHIDGLRHESNSLCEKMDSIYIVFTSCYHSHKVPVPSDHLDVAVVTRGKRI